MTSLPNLHPAVVHFPIALWIAAVVFDLACLAMRRCRWIDFSAAALYTLGAAGAGAAYLAGEEAEDSLVDLPASLTTLVEDHADWGWWTLMVFAAVAALRLTVTLVDRRGSERRHSGVRWLALLAALGGTWALVETADRGGALVYRHGVAVSAGAAAAAPASRSESHAAPPPAAKLAVGRDGSLSWTPEPGDPAGPAGMLVPAKGSDPNAVQPAPEVSAGGGGLALRVAGRGIVVLDVPNVYGDVQVEAVLDLSEFDGVAGLAHHARGLGDAGVFQVTTRGGASLVNLEGGAIRQLDAADAGLPAQPVRLTVSSAGQHLKGMVNGKVLVHGHERPAPEGSVGLLLDGAGTVRLLSMKVEPLSFPGD